MTWYSMFILMNNGLYYKLLKFQLKRHEKKNINKKQQNISLPIRQDSHLPQAGTYRQASFQ